MLKSEYNSMQKKITPPAELNQEILKMAEPRRVRRFRPAAAIAAALIAVMLAIPAMAAYVPAINELMFQVSPEMAARFTPIRESCIKNGIRMEVVSSSIHGATAEICVSFEDMEGDRINNQIRTGGDQLLGRNPFLSGTWGGGIGYFSYDDRANKVIMVIDETNSFWSELRGRYLTVKELYNGKITVQVDYLYVSGETASGEYCEQIVAEGPWRVTFPITESDYVGEYDDGVPMTEAIDQ